MLIGYARVSTKDQNLDMQIAALKQAGCKEENIYQEKQSGKSRHGRPELKKMLRALKKGDTLVVWRLDRLGRNTRDLIDLVEEFENQDVGFRSLTENIDTTSSQGKLVFTIFSALAEFERNLASERTRAGLEAARARGRLGGRRPALNKNQKEEIIRTYKANVVTNRRLAEMYNVSLRTIGNVISEYKKTKEEDPLYCD